MEENQNHIEVEDKKPPKKRRFGRYFLWFTIISLSLIVLFQLIFLFYSDQLFGRVLKEIVFQSSKGVYSIKYTDVRFNVFKNEIEFSDFELQSDSIRFFELEKNPDRTNRLFDFNSPHISVQGPSILKFIFDKVLVINEFDVDKPSLSMRVYGEFRSSQVGMRNFHESLSNYVSYLKIKNLNISNGAVSITSSNGADRKFLKINDIGSSVDGFVISKRQDSDKDSTLALTNLKLQLGINEFKIDSLNTLRFNHMDFSTKDSILSFTNFSLSPKEWVNNLNQPAFNFKHFDLKGVDFAQLYFNNNFQSRIILADSGSAHYRVTTQPDSIKAWTKISRLFDTISIDQIILLNTEVQYEKRFGNKQPNLLLPIVRLNFDQLFIDSSSFFKNKPNFYSKNVTLSVGEFNIYSIDSAQVITTQSLNLSTLNRELLLFDVSINPLKDNGKAIIDGNIRSIQFFGIDPLLAIQKAKFIGRAVLIENPKIEIKQGTIVGERFSNEALNTLLKKQFRTISISNVEIENANLLYKNRYGTNVLKLEDTKVYCNDFKTYRGSVPANSHLLSNWLTAEGKQSYLRLNDNMHIANVYGFKVFSKTGGFFANKFEIGLREGLNDSLLSNESFIRVGEFFNASVDGFNVNKLINDGKLELDYLESKGNNRLHVKIGNGSAGSKKIAGINIKEFNIDSVETEIEIGANQEILLKGKGLHFQACDLVWDTTYLNGRVDLYSILVEGNDFGIKHKGLEHGLTTKKLRINSNYNIVQLNGIDFRPFKEKFEGKNALWYQGSTFRISGIDIPKYLKTRELNAENLYISKPTVAFHGVTDGVYRLDEIMRNPQNKTNKVFTRATIDAIRIHNGKINYTNHIDSKEIEYDLNNLLVYLEGFAIDSNTTQTDTNIFFSKKAEIEFKDFEQVANDTSMILSFGAVKLFPHKNKVWLEDLEIRNRKPKGSLGYFAINSDKAELVDFDFNRFFLNRQMLMQKAEFFNPLLTVGLKKRKADNRTFFEHDIPKALTKNYSRIYADSLMLTDAMFQVNYREPESSKIITEKVDGWNVMFQVFEVNRNYPSLDFLYSKAIKAELKNYKRKLSDSLNTIKIGKLNVDVNRGRIYIDSVSLSPKYSKELYAKNFGKQIDRLEVFNQNSSIESFDFKSWLYDGSYHAKELKLNRTVVNVYTDKTLPENVSTSKRMPQEILRSLPFSLKIDTTFINNWSISYEEKVSYQMDPGIIYFNEFGGTISNVTNLDTSEGAVSIIKIKTGLMENGKVNLDMRIPLNHENDEFSFTGEMDGMDMREINPLLMSLTRIEIERGKTYKMDFKGSADKYFATGEVDLRYSDLKVKILDESGGDSGFGNKLLKFLANNFIIKGSNRLFPKTGKIDFVRDDQKSIFNYGARALLTGIKESIGLKNKEGVDSLDNEEDSEEKGN